MTLEELESVLPNGFHHASDFDTLIWPHSIV
jgi:hypothetical protein